MSCITNLEWKTLNNVPVENISFTFKVPNGNQHSELFVIIHKKGTYYYDFNNNIWNKCTFINKLELSFHKHINYEFVCSTIDSINKKLYFWNGISKLAIVTLDKKKKNNWKIFKLCFLGTKTQSVLINNKLCFIGGSDGNHYLQYNAQFEKFKIKYNFNDIFMGFCEHSIISLNTYIFVFGGFHAATYSILDTIYQYNNNNHIWNKLNIKMPKSLFSFGCTTDSTNKYILIFGGIDNTLQECNDIYIFSIFTYSFIKSNLYCPIKGQFYANTIINKKLNKIIVDGYIHKKWKLNEITNYNSPPIFLLNIVILYYSIEYVHLINKCNGQHWNIDIFNIFL